MRVGSRVGRVPTAQRQINEDSIKSIGFTTNTKVIDRAVSRQGLTGAISGSGGQKIERKIQDKSYFMTLLKTRISEISNELVKMNDKIGEINTNMTKYGALNKEYEIISKEVQELEGELADYNLAGDKYRSNMRAEDIEEVYNRIKLYNKKKMDESDNLFLDRTKIARFRPRAKERIRSHQRRKPKLRVTNISTKGRNGRTKQSINRGRKFFKE